MASHLQKILVSQPKPTTNKSPYYEMAEKYGFQVTFRPLIKVDAVDIKDFKAQRIELSDYTAIIFTARTAIDHFFRIAKEMRVQVPANMKYFCVTEAIAVYLQKYIVYRKRKIFYPQTGKLEDLLPSIVKNNKERFLVPASDVHKDNLIRLLEEKGINYQTAIMYRTVSNDFGPEEEFNYDLLLFFSPAGIASLLKNFPDFQQGDIVIGTFGPTTAQAVREAGLRLDIEAPNPDAPSMTAALDNYLKSIYLKTE